MAVTSPSLLSLNMVIFISKPLLLQTGQNPFSSVFRIFIFWLLLTTNVKSDSISFSFSGGFEPNTLTLAYLGDARPLDGVIQLTRRDGSQLRRSSVGRAVYIPPVHLWDRKTGKLAAFTTEFSFSANPLEGSINRGDGMAFFMSPLDANIPKQSSGGYLGLFSPDTALDPSKNQMLALEFDTFVNAWDHCVGSEYFEPHVGIDVNSINSVACEIWPIEYEPENATGTARFSYDPLTQQLSVSVSYNSRPVDLRHTVDLRTVLPEWVRIGFSAATGNLVETHDILSWSFQSTLSSSSTSL